MEIDIKNFSEVGILISLLPNYTVEFLQIRGIIVLCLGNKSEFTGKNDMTDKLICKVPSLEERI